MPNTNAQPGFLSLLDYRHRVAELYRQARQHERDPAQRWEEFRVARDELFGHHSQSPLLPEHQAQFKGLHYYPYNPALRFEAEVALVEDGKVREVELHADGLLRMQRCGTAQLHIANQDITLNVYQLLGYGGGIFVSFRDQTSGKTTYGGGRYLLDTIKHADLGSVDGRLVLDFNYAYNPSCAYNPRWDCPLAPPDNWLPVAIEAGEHAFDDHHEHSNA